MSKYLTAIPEHDSGWVIFSGDRPVSEGRDLHEAAGKRAGLLVGVPVAQAPSFAIVVPTTDASLLRDMAFAQIEKRGLGQGSAEETIFDYDVIEQAHGQTKLAVHLIDAPLPDDLILPTAAGYLPSPLVRQRIDDGALLWREGRQFAFAIFQNGRLLHSQLLSSSADLGAGTAQELNLLLLSLQGDPVFEDDMPERLLVLTDGLIVDEEARDAFDAKIQLATQYTELRGANKRARLRSPLMPAEILRYRRSKKTVRWVAAGLLLFLIAYFMFGIWTWKRAESAERQIASLERQIATIEPDVAMIQDIEARWAELEPAFDLNWFPVVQLSRITEALPGSGVVIREYETRGRQIFIKGQARDVQLAFRLQEDLQQMPGFERYQWDMPKPAMDSDNTATFQIQGEPIEE